MKGIIFREFLEMVEAKYGYIVVDEIIDASMVESKGIYTSVGTYPHKEFFMLAEQLSEITQTSVADLFLIYGEYAFSYFIRNYPYLIEMYHDAFDLLSHIEDVIHVDVLKLYPEAELPVLKIVEHSKRKLVMEYTSQRKMSEFAEGLISGCLICFKEKATIRKEILADDKSKVLFSITKNDE